MMKYERITNQEWSENIDLTQELGYSYIYKRLHELENQLEQGFLIEVKYPLHSKVYIIDYLDENGYSIEGGKPTVRECFITDIHQATRDSILYRVQPYDLPQGVLDGTITHLERWEWCHFYEENLFPTSEEAEKRLKELQE